MRALSPTSCPGGVGERGRREDWKKCIPTRDRRDSGSWYKRALLTVHLLSILTFRKDLRVFGAWKPDAGGDRQGAKSAPQPRQCRPGGSAHCPVILQVLLGKHIQVPVARTCHSCTGTPSFFLPVFLNEFYLK